LILLAVRHQQDRPRWFAAALALNLLLGLNLSTANYELGRVYSSLQSPAASLSSFLVNGELGFRYRMTRLGGRMLEKRSVADPGEWIVRSELCLGVNAGSLAEALAVPRTTLDLAARTPVRLMDRYAHSGFYSAAFGLLPFSFSWRPLDRITYARTSPYWNLPAPWTPTQIEGRLVYVTASGAEVRLPLQAGAAVLHLALYARGTGAARFVARDASGHILLDRTVNANAWEPMEVAVQGLGEVTLSIVSSSGVAAGWGELVAF
jgi:hypothetical protein